MALSVFKFTLDFNVGSAPSASVLPNVRLANSNVKTSVRRDFVGWNSGVVRRLDIRQVGVESVGNSGTAAQRAVRTIGIIGKVYCKH